MMMVLMRAKVEVSLLRELGGFNKFLIIEIDCSDDCGYTRI